MTETMVAAVNKPAWVDLATPNAEAARGFYTKLFGWQLEVNPDPQYGGYAMGRVDGKDAAGIGPTQSPDQPPAWSFYIRTDDLDRLSSKVTAAGGTVVAPAFDVGDQGRMAVFQDPTGAFISAWQGARMGTFHTHAPNTFRWADLNARGVDRAIEFYRQVFGWTPKQVGSGDQAYTEFQVDGESIAGASEMNPLFPAEVPSHWMVYFGVPDVDRTFRTAIDAGAREILAPQDFSGGKMAMLTDPQGASFGLLQVPRR